MTTAPELEGQRTIFEALAELQAQQADPNHIPDDLVCPHCGLTSATQFAYTLNHTW